MNGTNETKTTVEDEQAETTEAPKASGGASDAVRANVAAFRAEGNASMMGGWTE